MFKIDSLLTNQLKFNCFKQGFLLFVFFVCAQQQKAIVFSSSIGFYNYRQTANALMVYHHLKSNGFSDDDIILMIAENSGCN